ncbi:hypothetical protein BDZ91DRAFT_796952 [Kalaharituber pfeilii]|nr:hypothetical protein BDZ91DRAFT_796952 [Kalaharituber pfeilii]
MESSSATSIDSYNLQQCRAATAYHERVGVEGIEILSSIDKAHLGNHTRQPEIPPKTDSHSENETDRTISADSLNIISIQTDEYQDCLPDPNAATPPSAEDVKQEREKRSRVKKIVKCAALNFSRCLTISRAKVKGLFSWVVRLSAKRKRKDAEDDRLA